MDYYTSTDYRRQVALDAFIQRRWRPDVPDWDEFFLRLAPRFRFSDKFSADYVWSWQQRLNERGWVSLEDDLWGSGTVSLFGRRENTSHTHVLNASYIFTPTASLSARIRHYWSIVDYEEFYDLQADGTLASTPFNDLYLNEAEGTSAKDVNYNAWSVDLVYRWIFSPGSELSLVWKNTLNESGTAFPVGYWNNWKGMLGRGLHQFHFTSRLVLLGLRFIESRVKR